MTWPLKHSEKGAVQHGLTDLMGLAVGVEEGQAVETLVVLREAAEAQEESTDAHFHQHPSLLSTVGRQRFRDLYQLSRGLRLPLALAGWGLRSCLLRGAQRLGRCGWNGQGRSTRVHGHLWGLRERHHHSFFNFLDDFFFDLDTRMFSMWY